MHFKNRMHPLNIYKNPPNFKELAISFPDFRKFVKQELSGKLSIDYRDQNAVRALTQTLLKKDFDLQVDILESRLIPRVPLCLNYILWVEDLLGALALDRVPFGVDIGTGCVCIYSLLAAKKGWKMLATEVDLENCKCAEKNVSQNNLGELVSVKLVPSSSELLVGVIDEKTEYDFCMCNPPFFNSDEKPQNRTSRRTQLETVASEVPVEISVEGGEVSFISRIIQESQQLNTQIKIYTTLVGKKSDFLHLKKEVQKVCPKSVVCTEFCQGRTIRWGLAWSFLDINLKPESESAKVKKNKSKPLQWVLPSNSAENLNVALENCKNVLNKLKISFREESFDPGFVLKFKAYENTWSHLRRKKRLKARSNLEEPEPTHSDAISNEDCESSEAKRLKLDETCPDSTEAIKSLIVEGLILLKNVESCIILEMSWMSGNKEALYQIFQYLKNYWSKASYSDA